MFIVPEFANSDATLLCHTKPPTCERFSVTVLSFFFTQSAKLLCCSALLKAFITVFGVQMLQS